MFSIALIVSSYALSHGENKLGPHGGYVRMPGAFHTELVEKKPKTLEVYLLDINFKNPVIENSEVTAKLTNKTGKQQDTVNCLAQKEKMNFECKLDKDFSLYQKIKIKAIRNGIKSSKDADYEIPLKLDSSKHH